MKALLILGLVTASLLGSQASTWFIKGHHPVGDLSMIVEVRYRGRVLNLDEVTITYDDELRRMHFPGPTAPRYPRVGDSWKSCVVTSLPRPRTVWMCPDEPVSPNGIQ